MIHPATRHFVATSIARRHRRAAKDRGHLLRILGLPCPQQPSAAQGWLDADRRIRAEQSQAETQRMERSA